MATIKSHTDLNQSRELAKILPIESADMYYEWPNKKVHFKDDGYSGMCFSCWSLSVLLTVLPEIQGGKPIIALDDNYITYPHMSDLHTKADNLVDACAAMIEKLYKLNLL